MEGVHQERCNSNEVCIMCISLCWICPFLASLFRWCVLLFIYSYRQVRHNLYCYTPACLNGCKMCHNSCKILHNSWFSFMQLLHYLEASSEGVNQSSALCSMTYESWFSCVTYASFGGFYSTGMNPWNILRRWSTWANHKEVPFILNHRAQSNYLFFFESMFQRDSGYYRNRR